MATLRFDNTLGAVFIGFAVSAVLYGILWAQVHTYFGRFTLDRPFYRILVACILILETLHSVLSGHVVYYYSISNYNNPLALLVPTWTVIIQVLVGALISVLVKSAFAMRVWRFSNNNVILTGSILFLNVGIIVLAVIFVIKAFGIATFAEQPKLKWWTTALLTTSVFTDILIAVSLTYFLHHLRNGFSANTLINGLIAYSLETGAITSICGVATVVSFDTLSDSFVYICFFFILSKLYSNSLLATLNTRQAVRGRGTDRSPGTNGDFTIVHSAGQVQTTHSIFGQIDWSKRPPDIEVNVLKEVVSVPANPEARRGQEILDSPSSGSGSSNYSPNVPVSHQHPYSNPPYYENVPPERHRIRPPERIAVGRF